MRRTITRLALLLASLPAATLGCGSKGGDEATTGAVAEANHVGSAAAAPAPAAAPAASAAAAAEPAASAAAAEPADKTAAAPADTAAAPTSAGTPEAGERTFDCGAKGQKLCPMQAWMKGTMAAATSSGDAEKIAKALEYVAGKPPPGMSTWTSISKAGVAKARAGDIDGAKESCKKCHDAYKEKYKKTMRDRPW
jgi:hypothetical protein